MPHIAQDDGHIFPTSFHLLKTGNYTIYPTPRYLSIPFQCCLCQSKQLKFFLSKNVYHLLLVAFSLIPLTFHVPIRFTRCLWIIQGGNQQHIVSQPRIDNAFIGKEKTGLVPLFHPLQNLCSTPTTCMDHTVKYFVPGTQGIGKNESGKERLLWVFFMKHLRYVRRKLQDATRGLWRYKRKIVQVSWVNLIDPALANCP